MTLWKTINFAVSFSALFLAALILWRSGFDTGAAAMQCIDFHAAFGKEVAMKSNACKDAVEYKDSLAFKLFARRGE